VIAKGGFLSRGQVSIMHPRQRPIPARVFALSVAKVPSAALVRRDSTAPEVMEKGRGRRELDGRTVVQILLELSMTALGYYVLYCSTKGLINMLDPLRKSKEDREKVSPPLPT
jgi:hypothetical protein